MAKKDFDRVREIREKANAARKIEQRATKRRAMLIQGAVILGVLVVVGAIIAAVLVSGSLKNQPTEQSVPSSKGTATILGVAGIPLSVGGTAVTLGNSDAPVTLDIYEDFSCPHCADYEEQVGPTVSNLIASGDVVVNYHLIRFVTDYGLNAGSAATCVAVEQPEQWAGVHAALFAGHTQNSDGWKASDFIDYLKVMGITDETVQECVTSQKYTGWITSNTKTAQDDGVTSTPSLFINGEKSELLGPDALVAAVNAAKGD